MTIAIAITIFSTVAAETVDDAVGEIHEMALSDTVGATDKPEGWVGLGNTDDTFVEDGIDKSPIRGFDENGSVRSEGLGDDGSFELPDFADGLSNDPACESAGEEWIAHRKAMTVQYDTIEMDEDYKALASWQFVLDHNLSKTAVLDKSANRCFLGICATLYHLARHRLHVEGHYNSAVSMAKSMDRFVASIHPTKLDKANQDHIGNSLWPVNDMLIGKLQRDILTASRGRGVDKDCGSPKGCSKNLKPLHGNGFHQLANDTLQPFSHGGVPGESILFGDAFKIYIYDVDDYEELRTLASGASFCKNNQWGFEVLLHWYFLACDCRTDDPDKADFFFVPQYTACHLNVKTFGEEESNALFESLIPKLKHFKRSGGKDHLFVWGAGFAVDGPFRTWRKYIKDSIFLMTETEYWNPYSWQTQTNFHHGKDIVLPGKISVKEIKQHDQHARPMPDRNFVGDFVGWNRPLHVVQGTAESPRQRLLKWAARFPDMHIRQDVPYKEALIGSIDSRFCFVPRGKSAWSSRLFRTLYGKCVPVLLNDDYHLPFLSLFEQPLERWLIRWPMREVTDELADTLRGLDVGLLENMVLNAQEAKCWYIWPPPVVDAAHWDLEDGDLDAACPEWRTRNAYVAVTTLLFHKKRVTKSSFATFYTPDPLARGGILFSDASFAPI